MHVRGWTRQLEHPMPPQILCIEHTKPHIPEDNLGHPRQESLLAKHQNPLRCGPEHKPVSPRR